MYSSGKYQVPNAEYIFGVKIILPRKVRKFGISFSNPKYVIWKITKKHLEYTQPLKYSEQFFQMFGISNKIKIKYQKFLFNFPWKVGKGIKLKGTFAKFGANLYKFWRAMENQNFLVHWSFGAGLASAFEGRVVGYKSLQYSSQP